MSRRARALGVLAGAAPWVLLPCAAARAQGAEAGATPAAPAVAYEERLLEGGTLEPDIEAGDPRFTVRDTRGLPRTLSVETRLQQQRNGSSTRESAAFATAHGTLDTPNHGSLGLDVSQRLSHRRRSADVSGFDDLDTGRAAPGTLITLSQRQLPFDGGWRADNFVGAVSTHNTELASNAPRLGLPTRLMIGAATQWRNDASGLSLQAAAGAPGTPGSLGEGGLATQGDRVRTLGAQWQRGDWAYAAQWAQARAGSDGASLVDRPGDALWQSLRLRGDGWFAQGHWLASRDRVGDAAPTTSARRANAQWLDAGIDDGPVSHRVGLNRWPLAMQWLGSGIGADAQGGYYRWRWRTRQSLLETQVDLQRPLSGGTTTRQIWASGRQQLDQRDGVGAQLTQGHAQGGDAWRAVGFMDWNRAATAWRAFTGAGRDASGGRTWQVGGDAALELEQARWSSTLAVQRDAADSGTLLDLASSLSGRIGTRLSVDAGARAVWSSDGRSVTQSLNLGTQWAFAAGWSVVGALNASRGRASVPAAGPSALPPPLEASNPTVTSHFAWLGLRYDLAAGSPEVPLGGSVAAGGGRLEGVLFLDANGNGRVDASEARAANVTVVLDGRYAVRTDAQGRFEFAFVAAGDHQLWVVPDNLPLPWQVADEGRRTVRISTRQTTRVEIAAQQGGL